MSKEGKLKIKKSNDSVVATLYTTDIVRAGNNRIVTLNSGGWKTSTTKKSINRVLDMLQIPIHVFTHEKEWKITNKDGIILSFEDGKEYNY